MHVCMWVGMYVFVLGLYFVCVWVSTWNFVVDVSENQNCGSGWQDNQAADCELKLLIFFLFILIQWLGNFVEVVSGFSLNK